MRGRSQADVRSVKFKAGSTIEHESEVADRLVCLHAIEDPGDAWIEALRRASIGRHVGRVAGGGVADTREDLRRSTAEAPETALLARRGVILLAGCAAPGGGANMSSPDLDHMRAVGVNGCHPVKA